MTPEAQRVAIADSCYQLGLRFKELPHFDEDLNAMHFAESALDRAYGRKIRIYWGFLREVVTRATGNPEYPCIIEMLIHATASQRAEAFLRTVGEWQDSRLTQSPAPTPP